MIPFLRPGGHWADVFNRRLSKRDFVMAGVPTPLFFVSANKEDKAMGVVYDAISGVQGSLQGSATMGTVANSAYGRYSSTKLPDIPCFSLGASGYLSFPGIGSVIPANGVVWVGAILRLTNAQAALFAGQPTERRRTMVARSFRNPGGTNTAMSGWGAYFSQYKSAVGTATYYSPNANFRTAYTATQTATLAAGRTGGSFWGAHPDTHLRMVFFRVNRSAGLNGFEVHSECEPGNYNYEAGNGTAVPVLTDVLDRDLLVGGTLDPNTGSFVTDFLDGEVVALGIWSFWGPRESQLQTTAPTPHAHRYWMEILPRLSMASRDISSIPTLAVPYTPREYYVDSAANALVPKGSVGTLVQPGQVFRIPTTNKIYKALTAGVLGSTTVTAGSVAAVQELRVRIGAIPNFDPAGVPSVLVTEVSGESKNLPMPSVSTEGLLPGDVLRIAGSHVPTTKATDSDSRTLRREYLRHAAYLETTRPYYALYTGIGRSGAPVVVAPYPGEQLRLSDVEIWEIQAYHGTFFVSNLAPSATSLRFIASRSRLFLNSLRSKGGLLEVTASCVLDIHDCYIRHRRGIVQDYTGFSLSDVCGPEYDNFTNISVAGIDTPTGGGLSLHLYGGVLSGPALDIGQPHGNTAIRYFGARHKHKTRSDASTSGGKRIFYSYNQKPNAGPSKVVYYGGVPGLPYGLNNTMSYQMRSSNVSSFFDGLRGTKQSAPIEVMTQPTKVITSTYRKNGNIWLGGKRATLLARGNAAHQHRVQYLRRYISTPGAGTISIYFTTSSVPSTITFSGEISYTKVSGGRGYLVLNGTAPHVMGSTTEWVAPLASAGRIDLTTTNMAAGFVEICLDGMFAIGGSGDFLVDPFFEVS